MLVFAIKKQILALVFIGANCFCMNPKRHTTFDRTTTFLPVSNISNSVPLQNSNFGLPEGNPIGYRATRSVVATNAPLMTLKHYQAALAKLGAIPIRGFVLTLTHDDLITAKKYPKTQLLENRNLLSQQLADRNQQLSLIEKVVISKTGVELWANPESLHLLPVEIQNQWYKYRVEGQTISNEIIFLEKQLAINNKLLAYMDVGIERERSKFAQALEVVPPIEIREHIIPKLRNELIKIESSKNAVQTRFDIESNSLEIFKKTSNESNVKALSDYVDNLSATLFDLDIQESVIKAKIVYAQEIVQYHEHQYANDAKRGLSSLQNQTSDLQTHRIAGSIDQAIKENYAQIHEQQIILSPQTQTVLKECGVNISQLKKANFLQKELVDQVLAGVDRCALVYRDTQNLEVKDIVKHTLEATAKTIDAIENGTPREAITATYTFRMAETIVQTIAEASRSIVRGAATGVYDGIKDALIAEGNMYRHPRQTFKQLGKDLIHLGGIIFRLWTRDPVSVVKWVNFCESVINSPLEKIVHGISSMISSFLTPSCFSIFSKVMEVSRLAGFVEKNFENVQRAANLGKKTESIAQDATHIAQAAHIDAVHKTEIAAVEIKNIAQNLHKAEQLAAQVTKLDSSLGNIQVLEAAVRIFADVPGAVGKDGPITKLLENGLAGASVGNLNVARGHAFELEKAYQLAKEGKKIIAFGQKRQAGSVVKEFDIILENTLIECKNINWLNEDFTRLTSLTGSRIKIAKELNKNFEFHSKNPIPDSFKTWLSKNNVPFFEG